MNPRSVRICYPFYLDLWNPIQTIHRQVGQRLPPSFSVHGLVFSSTADVADRFDTTAIPPSMNSFHRVLKFLKIYSMKADIIHTGPQRRDFFAGLTQLRGAKVVHSLHKPPNKESKKLDSILTSQADIVTAVSPYVKQRAEEVLAPKKKIYVVPNGVDIETFHPKVSKTVSQKVIFVGRLEERKHPELVVKLAKERPNLQFYIRGNGSLQKQLETLAPSNVTFIPKLSTKALAELYAEASILLFPSESEGFGMVTLEAMASGTPVVALKDGNHPHLITEENGRLCDTLDTEEWIEAITEVRAIRPELMPRKTVKQYSWQKVAEKYTSLYKLLLN